jgi:hypothetical protein
MRSALLISNQSTDKAKIRSAFKTAIRLKTVSDVAGAIRAMG